MSRPLAPAFPAWLMVWVVVLSVLRCGAADPEVDRLLRQVQDAWRQKDYRTAEQVVNQALSIAPADATVYLVKGRILSDAGKGEEAIGAYTKALELEPGQTAIYQWRGGEQFKLGHIQASIDDFDAYLAARPDQEPHHWQRGISYYYAGKFEEGRRQFESHQKVNAHDVENAVWHYLCVAAAAGTNEARQVLIPIQGDTRIPMKEVHALFAGTGKVDAIWKAVEAAPERSARTAQFYAHLYLGLYYEAMKQAKASGEEIAKAVALADEAGYMGAVARVHEQLRKAGSTLQ